MFDGIVGGVILYLAGTVSGWWLRGYIDNVQSGHSEGKFVALIVTCIWSVSVLAEIFMPPYQTAFYVHVLMGALNGVFLKDVLNVKLPGSFGSGRRGKK